MKFKHVTVTGPEGYRCKVHGELELENIVVYKRPTGYLHRKCRICYNALMRGNRKRYNADFRHRDEFRVWRRKQRADQRERVIHHYGGKCACCGMDQPRFLTIDHFNNDGAQHRREMGSGGGSQIYLWLEKNGYPNGGRFQVLCYNCNLGRAFNDGICPHVG